MKPEASLKGTPSGDRSMAAPARLVPRAPGPAGAGVCVGLRALRRLVSGAAPSADLLVARLPLFRSRDSPESPCVRRASSASDDSCIPEEI